MLSCNDSLVKRKFGSFHSSNIEEQLEASLGPNYNPPEFPVTLPDFKCYDKFDKSNFGLVIKKNHFLLEDKYVFLNHGAFGCVLKEALHVLHKLNFYVERQPVRFIDRELFPFIVHSQKRLSDIVGCKSTDIAFVENATMGTNAVLKSMNFSKDDTIYFLNVCYGAVKKSLQQLHMKSGVQLQEESIAFPLESKATITELVKSTLKHNTKLAIFDHVPSNTPFVMPIKELVKICNDKNVPVLIDGAHALGSVDLNLDEIRPDFYVSNAHKWFCAPKGCAFLYVKPCLQPSITALCVSHGHGCGFQSELTYYGLKDYCPYLALHCCINFWNALGLKQSQERNMELLHKAVNLFMKKWDGKLLAPIEMHRTMCCVSLPLELYAGENVTYELAETIQNELFYDYNIEVPIKCIQGVLYVRISCHVYNVMDDYQKLADAFLSMVSKCK